MPPVTSVTEEHLNKKINEFAQAIQKYDHYGYKNYETLVSFLIVTLQGFALFNLIYSNNTMTWLYTIPTLLIAYFVTDFVNGLIHMIMDNNTHYTSVVGPYIAAFHLHHAKYFYTNRSPLKVYFDESGTKFWLLIYLLLIVLIQLTFNISTPLNLGLVAFGIFSSVAELSHYWCHNATDENKFIVWLQNNHILLSKKHHLAHHRSDNLQYAFLNGTTDPLINLIARYFFKGYKNYADIHTNAYMKIKK